MYSVVFSRLQQFDVFFFDSPIFADLAVRLKKLQNTLIIYDCPDDYFAYSEIGESFKQSERDVAIVADIIITPTESIRSKILSRNKGKLNVRVIPNGVPRAEIARVPNMRKPEAVSRIGFIGTLASWVDFNLIFDVATRMPNCEFVVAGDGPNYSNWKKSPSNCKFIGRVSMAKRHEVISSFDVGLIPFKRVSLADSAFPLKLLEYFARGVPVVSSPLVETKNIAEGFAYFADNVDVWIAQINNALNDSFETKMSYIEFASKYTWENTADLLLNAASEYLASG
jgi:glycosyltransferase involved in cell wall biosynthesis